jgi:tetratricopeptide (TPR) repeat protein
VLLATLLVDHGYKQAVVAGARAAGIENLRQGSAMLEQLIAEDPQSPRLRRVLGLSYSRTAEILRDDAAARVETLALYRKAIDTKEALVAEAPGNAELRRLVAYDQYEMARLLAEMKDVGRALGQDRMALSSLQKLAGADPADTQLQQDIGRIRGHLGEMFTKLGDPSNAIEQLRLSLISLEKLPGAQDPRLLTGFTVATDQFWLGMAHTLIASARTLSPERRGQECREADSWFHKSLRAFVLIRDRAPPEGGGTDRVDDIRRQLSRCDAVHQ